MTKIKNFSFCIITLLLLLSSCDKNKDNLLFTLNVKITSVDKIDDFSKFIVTLTELKSAESYNVKSNKEGIAQFKVPEGLYSISCEDLDESTGVTSYSGSLTQYSFTNDKAEVELPITSIINSLDKSFVLDELYFNGDKEGAYSTKYHDQYFTIRNISNKSLIANGLSFGVVAEFSSFELNSEMRSYLPDNIVISQFYTIPKSGKPCVLKPNESIVIALSAIDHTEGGKVKNTVDLTGADYEIFVDHEYVMNPDNKLVPNVDVNFTTFQAFHWQYNGSTPMILFRIDGDVENLVANNKKLFDNPASYGTVQQEYVILPTKYIIDGVETGVLDNYITKILPDNIDKGAHLIKGDKMPGSGFNGQFIQRKRIIVDGVETVQDTNNSKSDFETIEHGQKSYVKK